MIEDTDVFTVKEKRYINEFPRKQITVLKISLVIKKVGCVNFL